MGKTKPVEVLLLVLIVTAVSGLKFRENQNKIIKVKLGSKAVLPCLFESASQDTAALDITWLNSNGTVMTYANGEAHPVQTSSLFGRVSLPAANIISAVPPGKVSCSLQRTVVNGDDVVLTCKSMVGSKPLKYTWSTASMPRSAKQDMAAGTLTLRNVSLRDGGKDGGKYVCSIQNDIGTAKCSVFLALPPGKKNKAGVIAGAVIAVLLAVLLITCLVTWILHRQKQSKVPEQNYEVRMDESPPLSRPGSRAKSGLSVTSAAQTSGF
uniref:Ig-like domain-containing protein n=1 Tax=Eptatretus burgeri TaxID=7764 RepID=A0A8C4QFN6_EPTBU